MRRITAVFLLTILCLCFTSCQKTVQKPVDAIYVYHEGFGQRFPEYKIDLKNKEFWEFTSDVGANYIARDPSSKNEGFTLICNLEDDNIETFIQDSSRYGFTTWNESYTNDSVVDGHQWGITILFSDSTKKEITGSNKYPKTWNDMYDAFENLTGEDILLSKGE